MNNTKNIMNEMRALFRSSPRLILFTAIFAYLVSSKFIALRFAAYFIITEILNALLKWLFGSFKNTFPNIITRPKGAGNCLGCSTFPSTDESCINVDHHIGMPSGHSMGATMAATFWIWWIWENDKTSSLQSKIIRSTLLAMFSIGVMISRLSFVENCHTTAQVIIGGLLGVVVGTSFYFLDKKVISKW